MPDLRTPEELAVIYGGTMPYGEALALQQRLHAQVVTGEGTHVLLFVEHPPTLTLGKHSDLAHLSFSEDHYRMQGVELAHTDRGGQVTAHMPRQMVVYPILKLSTYRLSPKRYVALLEEGVIRLLAAYGIDAQRDSDHAGVWVGKDKICAIGIRIKERVTLHGIALNVTNDLALFEQIVPCGITGRGVTSMAGLLNRTVDLEQLRLKFASEFKSLLDTGIAASRRSTPLQWQEGLSTI
ncbi:MAG: lipoyl(octanoyl) transferase LipB [Proteobacteria bacterium]|nr:lipoyl(octanoyl) transferase LipB [Pseudomonadota bacterium]